MNDVKDMLTKYQDELNKIVSNIEATKREINRLNVLGIELTAKANVLAGKVEALRELENAEVDAVVTETKESE